MSWLSSAFEGDFKPLTSGISNITGISKTPLAQIGGKNTKVDLEIAAALAALGLTGGAAGGLIPGLGAVGAGIGDAAAGIGSGISEGIAGIGGALSGLGSGIDLSALGIGGSGVDLATAPLGDIAASQGIVPLAAEGSPATAASFSGDLAGGDLSSWLGTLGEGQQAGGANAFASTAAATPGAAANPGLDSLASIGPGSVPPSAPFADPAAAGGGFNSIDAAAGVPGLNGFPSSTAPGGLMNFLSNNKGLVASLGAGVAGTALAPQLSKLINKVPQQGNLDALAGQESALAGQQAAYGSQLQQPLLTGVLPQQQQQVVDNAVQDAVNTTKARYANLGLSGSTMEADAIAQITNQKLAMQGQLEQQMAALGGSAVNSAGSFLGNQDAIYNQLMNAQISQDNNLQNAIERFAAAAATGGGTNKSALNLQLGGTSSTGA